MMMPLSLCVCLALCLLLLCSCACMHAEIMHSKGILVAGEGTPLCPIRSRTTATDPPHRNSWETLEAARG